MNLFKTPSENRKGKCDPCNTIKPLLRCKQVIDITLKVLKVLKSNLYRFSHTVRETRTLGVFYKSKTIDGLNLKKPF